MIVVIIILVVIAVIFIVNYNGKKHDEDIRKYDKPTNSNPPNPSARMMDIVHSIRDSSTGHYWEGFKRRKPTEAREIELLTGRDLSKMSGKMAFEIVTTLLRWSENAKVPISGLKQWFIVNSKKQAGEVPLDEIIKLLKYEKIKEAQQFHISPDNTACNFMIEFLLEEQAEQEKARINAHFAKQMNISDEEMPAFIEDIKQREQELNLAPDISQYDREENKLFHLAEKGVEMFDDLLVDINKPRVDLSEDGRIEALILCSTMVMQLHSNFKNETDLDIQTDRYFLLLHDATISSDIDDHLSFLNSRIAFYNEQLAELNNLSGFAKALPGKNLERIYKLLYKSPLGDTKDLDSISVSMNEMVMFKGAFEIAQKSMNMGKNRICGNESSIDIDIRNKLMTVFENIFPPQAKAQANQDLAFVITDVVIDAIKEGNLSGQISSVIPSNCINQITELIKLYQEKQFDDILTDVQQEFAMKFPK